MNSFLVSRRLCGSHQPERLSLCEGGPVEVVVEGAERMVVGHQPQLGARIPACAVRPDVAQDVFMPIDR